MELLAEALFGRTVVQDDGDLDATLWGLRYQLLAAAAGAAIEAAEQGCSRAVLLVHEFVSHPGDMTPAELTDHTRNADDLDEFARALGVAGAPSPPGIIKLTRTHQTAFAPSGMPLLLAHLTTLLRPKA